MNPSGSIPQPLTDPGGNESGLTSLRVLRPGLASLRGPDRSWGPGKLLLSRSQRAKCRILHAYHPVDTVVAILLGDYIQQNDPDAGDDTGSEEKDGKPTKGTVNGAIKNLYANPDEVGMDYTFVDEEFQAKWPPRPMPELVTEGTRQPRKTRGVAVVPLQAEHGHDSDSDEIICLEDKPAVKRQRVETPRVSHGTGRLSFKASSAPSPFTSSAYKKQFERVIPPPKVPRRQISGLSAASASFSSQNTRVPGPQRPAHANAPQQPESIRRTVTPLNPIDPPKEIEKEPEVEVEEDPYAPVQFFLSKLEFNLSQWHETLKSQGLGRKDELFAIAGWKEEDLVSFFKNVAEDTIPAGHRALLIRGLKTWHADGRLSMYL